jgi:restriction modification system DNA specificity subunit
MKSVVCSAVNNMKDSGIKWLGMIPKHWVKGILSSYFYQQKELNFDLREQNLLSLSYGKIIDKDITTKEGLLPKSFDNYNVIQKGDIVFRLTDLQNDKKSLRTGLCKRNGIITSAYVTIRKKIELCPDFFAYLFHVYDICKVYYGLGSGVRQGLNFNELKKLPLILPPTLAEQRAIADWLDAKCADIDAAIELQQRMIDKLKAYKTAVIHQAVTKGLDKNANLKDSGVQWIGEVPEHWGIVNIGSLYNQRNEKVSDKDYKPLSVTKKGILPQLETAAKTDNGDNRKLVRKNDFAINSRSDRKGSCGISDYDGSVSLINIVLYPIQEIENRYYNWLFHSPEFAEEFYRLGHGIVADLWTTRWSEMKGMRILLPPTLTEQRAIADWLDAKCADIDATIALKEQKQEKLKAYKKTIIFEYVTGKKQVDNINKQL